MTAGAYVLMQELRLEAGPNVLLCAGIESGNNMRRIVLDRHQQRSRRTVRPTSSLFPIPKCADRYMKETRELFLGQSSAPADIRDNSGRYLKGPRWFPFPTHNLGRLRGAFNQFFKQLLVHGFNVYVMNYKGKLVFIGPYGAG